MHLPETLHVASSTLTLTTHLLVDNSFLLALSPAILLLMLIASIPFLTLIFRLLLVGYVTRPSKDSSLEWHLYTWADWAIVGSVAVWLWSWAVARGILRMTCSSVIGLWYFAELAVSLHLRCQHSDSSLSVPMHRNHDECLRMVSTPLSSALRGRRLVQLRCPAFCSPLSVFCTF